MVKISLNASVSEYYNVGGNNEKTNLEVVNEICNILDDIVPSNSKSYYELIEFVEDRPGHDKRYAIDASKIEKDLAWYPEETFDTGLRKTVEWYIKNRSLWNNANYDTLSATKRRGLGKKWKNGKV